MQSTVRIQQSPPIDLKFTDGKILTMDGFDIEQNNGLDPDCDEDDIATGRLTHNDHFDRVMFCEPIALDKRFRA